MLVCHANPLKSASELDYPPFSIIGEDGIPTGFSVELLQEVVKAAGLTITFDVGPWHEIKQQLIDGRLDLLPLVSYSEKRDQLLDFTAPYIRMRGTIFVRKGDGTIQSEADLRGKSLLVMKGDTAHEYALRHQLTDRLILTDTFEEAMEQLSQGKHDAVMIQKLVGYQLIKRLGITNLVDVGSTKGAI